jgi:hypothetical protein
MVANFDAEELNTLCFKLGIAHDDFSNARTVKAREMIGFMERHGRLAELVAHLQQERPHREWMVKEGAALKTEDIVNKAKGDLFVLFGLQLWLNAWQ